MQVALLVLATDFGISLAVSLAITAISIGASYLSSYLLKPKNKSSPVALDNEPTSISTRGAFIPYLIGRRRVGSIFGFVGHRQAVSAGRQPGGKGSRGRKTQGNTSELVYFEDGWHILCVGPAKRLHRIWENGKLIWTGPIDNVSHPSGAGIQTKSGDFFTIHWGESTQPVNPVLGGSPPIGMGVTSQWPFVCYAYWNKRLGPSPRWPLIEYDIETEVQASTDFLTRSSSAIDASLVGPPAQEIKGVNPAHAIYQLLFAPFPLGLNQDTNLFDLNCLEEVGTICRDEGLPISVYAPDGQDALGILSSIMQDIGCMLGWDPVSGKFRFKLVRPGETPINLPEAMIASPLPEVERPLFGLPTDKAVFAFADKDHDFKTVTIALDDDGQATYQNFQRAQHVEMRSVIHFEVAKRVAERRSQELLASAAKYTIQANRGARRLLPGALITVPADITTDVLRVTDIGLSPLSGKVQLTCVTDFYGTGTVAQNAAAIPGGGNQTFTVDPDLEFTFIEVPAYLLGSAGQALLVLRIRTSTNENQAEIFLSADNVTYTDEGSETLVQTGGKLLVGMLATDPYSIAQGPTFTVEGPDVGQALDLSGDLPSWAAGRQLAVIGEEIFFVQKITALGGSTYRLDGLKRARYDTARVAHSINDVVYLFQDTGAFDFTDALLAPAALLYLKTDPAGLGGSVDLSTVTPVSKTLYGKGIVPMPPGALKTGNGSSSYSTGQDVFLKWGYRSALPPSGTGAGMIPAGSAYGDSPVDGSFEIRFLTTADVLKATKFSATPNYTYTNVNLVADFGSETDMHVEVRDVNGGWRSSPILLTVKKV